MTTTDIRIRYPESINPFRFAAKVEELLHDACCFTPPRVRDMPCYVIITIATDDLFAVEDALRDAKLIS